VRPAFLVDLPAAKSEAGAGGEASRSSQTHLGGRLVSLTHHMLVPYRPDPQTMLFSSQAWCVGTPFRLDDDDPNDDGDDEDEFEDDEEGEDDEEDDEEVPETWQVL
jgi:hypothetical protein